MANTGDINANGLMLPAALRGILGLDAPAPTAPQADAVSGVTPYAPPVPQSVLDMLNPPKPAVDAPPVQNGQDFKVAAPNVPSTAAGVAQANAAYGKRQAKAQQQAYADSQRMPTLADTQRQQREAAQQELDANELATQATAAAANDTYAVNKQAETDIKASNDQLKAMQAESAKVRAAKEQAVTAAMQEVDSYKLDQNRYWKNASTAKQVGWGIAMALSGLGDALQHKSGPNPVIGMLEGTIDKDVRAQLDARDQLKEKLGRASAEVDKWDRFSQNKEAQFLANRAQAKELVAQQLLTAASKYGSDIAIANGTKAAAEIRKGAAKDAQTAVDLAHSHAMQEGQLKVSQQNVAIAGGHLALDRERFKADNEFRQQQLDLEAAKAAAAAKAKDPNEAKLIQERAMGGEVTPIKDKDGNVVDAKVGLITMKDGSVWIPKGPESTVAALHKKHSAATALVQTLDEIRKLGPEWLSDTANSDKLQKLKQLMGDARLQAIAAKDLGVPTGHDIELAEDFLGTSDPTRYKDSLAGIMQSRQSIVRDHNVELKTAGLDKEWDPPDLGKKGALQMPEDAESEMLLEVSPRTDPGRVARDLGVKPTDAKAIADAWRANGGMLNAQRQALEALGAGLQSPDIKIRERAYAQLEASANSAQAAGVREYAQQLLAGATTPKMEANESVSDPNAGKAVARDSISQPRTPSKGTKR